MEKQQFVEFSGEFWDMTPSKITDSLALDDNSLDEFSSIRLLQFFAALESNFNVKIENLDSILTFGDVYKNISPQ